MQILFTHQLFKSFVSLELSFLGIYLFFRFFWAAPLPAEHCTVLLVL